MANTFSYYPQTANRKKKPRLKSVKFGNGYHQKYGDGINSNLDEWTLTFVDRRSVCEVIDDFLNDNYLTYFMWTPPGGTELPYECVEWSISYGPVVSTVTAKFKQWPGLIDTTSYWPGDDETWYSDTDVWPDD